MSQNKQIKKKDRETRRNWYVSWQICKNCTGDQAVVKVSILRSVLGYEAVTTPPHTHTLVEASIQGDAGWSKVQRLRVSNPSCLSWTSNETDLLWIPLIMRNDPFNEVFNHSHRSPSWQSCYVKTAVHMKRGGGQFFFIIVTNDK